MLDGLLEFLDNIEKYSAVEEVQKEFIIESKEIVKLVQGQLERGIDGNDEPVYLMRHGRKEYTYARYTQWRKDIFGQGIGALTDRITNYMSGEFYGSLFVETYDNGTFEVKSADPKIWLIRDRSGDAIIDLNYESQQYLFREEMAADLQENINELFYTK